MPPSVTAEHDAEMHEILDYAQMPSTMPSVTAEHDAEHWCMLSCTRPRVRDQVESETVGLAVQNSSPTNKEGSSTIDTDNLFVQSGTSDWPHPPLGRRSARQGKETSSGIARFLFVCGSGA